MDSSVNIRDSNNYPWYENGWISSAYSCQTLNTIRPNSQRAHINAAHALYVGGAAGRTGWVPSLGAEPRRKNKCVAGAGIGRNGDLPDIRQCIKKGESPLSIYPYGNDANNYSNVHIANVGWRNTQRYLAVGGDNAFAGWNFIGQYMMQGRPRFSANAIGIAGWIESEASNGPAADGGAAADAALGNCSADGVAQCGAVLGMPDLSAGLAGRGGGGPQFNGRIFRLQPNITQIEIGANAVTPVEAATAAANWGAPQLVANTWRHTIYQDAAIGNGSPNGSYDNDLILYQFTNMLPIRDNRFQPNEPNLNITESFQDKNFNSIDEHETLAAGGARWVPIWDVKHSLPNIYDNDRCRYLIFSCGGSVVPNSDKLPREFRSSVEWIDYLKQIMEPQGLDDNFVRFIQAEMDDGPQNLSDYFYKILRTCDPVKVTEARRSYLAREYPPSSDFINYQNLIERKSANLLDERDIGNNRFNWPPYPRKGIDMKDKFRGKIPDAGLGSRNTPGVADDAIGEFYSKWKLMNRDSINYIHEDLNAADGGLYAIPHFKSSSSYY